MKELAKTKEDYLAIPDMPMGSPPSPKIVGMVVTPGGAVSVATDRCVYLLMFDEASGDYNPRKVFDLGDVKDG